MGDPYWRYSAQSERGSVPRPDYQAHLPLEASSSASQLSLPPRDLRSSSIDHLVRDGPRLRPGAYGVDHISGIGVQTDPGLGQQSAGIISSRGYHSPVNLRQDVPVASGSGVPDLVYEKPASQQRANGLPVAAMESNVLFVDGLPTDCTRREVGHLFRPFIGFKDIKVVHKEPRQSGDKAMVLCFVEFNDAKCAFTAMEALQGYKFDDKKPNSPVLKIQFAHFPFRLPSENNHPGFAIQR